MLRSGAGAPAWNLALDEALLLSSDARPVLRLYTWEPAGLSLGHFQPAEPFVERAARAGAVLVRRPTGGGAIHHDRELTFCLIATPGEDGYPRSTEDAYRAVHEALLEALAELGVEVGFRGGDAPRSVHPRAATLCFEDTTVFDLVDAGGAKLVGSAQRRRDGRVLHHGSIPLETPSLTPGAASLAGLLGRPVSWERAADAVQRAFAARLCAGGLAPDAPSDAERAAAAARQAALRVAL